MTSRPAKPTEPSTPAPDPVDPSAAPAEPASDPAPRHPLDHDGDGRPGGSAPPPAVTHLVVTRAAPDRGLSHGEVIAVADADVKALFAADVARAATADEVELAQPRVRAWSPPSAA